LERIQGIPRPLPLHGPAFRVRQAQSAATALRFEDAVFLQEIRDDLLLVSLEPAGEHGDEHG
jgi:hypothetical protein